MISETSEVFDMTAAAWARTTRFVSSCGGTRSGKTVANLQLLSYLASKDTVPTITSVVSETMPHLKRGAIRDFQMIWGDAWEDSRWNKTDCIYTLPNGSLIEFFSADAPSKVHGPARDRLFINEVQNISYEVARQLFVRTKDKIIIDYNPTHSFWAMEVLEPRDNCEVIHSTYRNNRSSTTGRSFLTDNQIEEIEGNKDDANWWKVYGLGLVGTLEGLIYSFDQVDRMPEDSGLAEVYGMDFGFTNDPTAIVRLLVDTGRKEVWADERLYRTRMMNSDIVDFLKEDKLTRAVPIYADCAEPKSIAEISAAGFNLYPSDKDAPVGSDKLTFQIQWVQGWKLHVTKGSVNLIKELRNYTWAKDKNGKELNRPIDNWNHILDALRYGLYSHFARNAGYNNYKFTFSSRHGYSHH